MVVHQREHSTNSFHEKKCNLHCANGGYCSINTQTSSSHNLADGHLREMCICPQGYTGITCLQRVASMERCHQYNTDTHICLNGGYCRQVMNDGGTDVNAGAGFLGHNSATHSDGDAAESKSEWLCDCIEAAGVSPFAADMCKRPHTEFCDDNGISFCTNGGSCKNHLINPEIKIQYEGSDGCLCPKEFSGPHCEHLNELLIINGFKSDDQLDFFDITELGEEHGEIKATNGYSDKSSWGLGLFFVVGALVVVGVLYKRRTSDKSHRHNQLVEDSSELHHEQFHDDGDHEPYAMRDISLT